MFTEFPIILTQEEKCKTMGEKQNQFMVASLYIYSSQLTIHPIKLCRWVKRAGTGPAGAWWVQALDLTV